MLLELFWPCHEEEILQSFCRKWNTFVCVCAHTRISIYARTSAWQSPTWTTSYVL